MIDRLNAALVDRYQVLKPELAAVVGVDMAMATVRRLDLIHNLQPTQPHRAERE